MAVTPWRYTSVDLVTGAVIAALPLHDVTFTSVLNGAGPMKASLRLPVDDLELADAYVDACEETRRCIYIEHEHTGVVVWAGPIWTTTYNTDTQTIEIQGAEMWSYWRRRRIRWSVDYLGKDQAAIARSLLRRAQGALGGNIHLRLPILDGGVARDRSYRVFEDKQLGEAIEQLAHVEQGFDFWIEVRRVGTSFLRYFRTAYPQRGRDVATSGLYLTLGNNMLKLELPRNGTTTANSIKAIGAGEGLDMLQAVATDLDVLDDGYPLLEDSASYKDVKIQATLSGHAQAELAAGSRPTSLPKATVLADSEPFLGTYWPGDRALLRVPANTEPRWIDGVEIPARLYSYTVAPPDDGNPPTVALTFEETAA